MFTTDHSILNAFTVDVEDYFHVGAFADQIATSDWDHYESRVVRNTHRLLRLLDIHGVHGTFFILGWVADRYPSLVKEIQRSGHEIGSHSFWHRPIYDLTPDSFREDLRQASAAIEETTSVRVRAFRAPSFSITKKSLWALKVLVEEGFQIDSSIFPIRHDRYGIPDAERFPHEIRGGAGRITEFPASVHRIWKLNLPVAGGGYFRLYPAALSLHWLGMINRQHQRPFVFYVHPWELDPQQPVMHGSFRSRWRHYQHLDTTEPKLHRLLREFKFGTISEALAANQPCELSRPYDQTYSQRQLKLANPL